jgi:hypothetical protein
MTHILDREQIAEAVRRLVNSDDSVIGAVLVGSVANTVSDPFSDLDYFLFVDVTAWSRSRQHGPWWSSANLRQWLGSGGLQVGWHYWAGTEKHYLTVGTTRLDFSLLAEERRGEIVYWPRLFFPPTGILKDADGCIAKAYASNAQATLPDAENDLSSYVMALCDVAKQLLRRETVNARLRFRSVVESRARIMRQLPLGTALWREPTRHAEETLLRDQVAELERMAFMPTAAELRRWIQTEVSTLAQVCHDEPDRKGYLALYQAYLREDSS